MTYTPGEGRGGRWSSHLEGGLEPTQPYDAAAARAKRPRQVTSWPRTGDAGAKATMDVDEHTAPLPEPDPLEHARRQLGIPLAEAVQGVGVLGAAFQAAAPAVEALADVVKLEPAPPSRRGWLDRALRRFT